MTSIQLIRGYDKMVNLEYLKKKANRKELLKQIVLNSESIMETDTRTWFDKEIPTDLFRTLCFIDGCNHQKYQPYVRFNNTMLLKDDNAKSNLRSISLVGFKYQDNVTLHSFNKVVHFSKEFFLEMRGYHVVGRKDADSTKVDEIDGLITYHINDTETGNKVYVGHSLIHVSEFDGNEPSLIFRIDRMFWDMLNDCVKMKKGVDLITGKLFSNVRGTVYADVNPTTHIFSYSFSREDSKGTKAYYQALYKDVLAINKHLPSIMEFTNLRKTLFGCN